MRRLFVVGLVVAVLGFAAWQRWGRPSADRVPVPAPADTASTGLRAARLYFAAPGGDSLVSETRDLPERGSLHERVAALVAELDRGPRGPGVAALPAGTSVLHVYLDDEGLLTLDLSRAFLQNFRGGSGAEYLAVASLVRTLGANEPEVRQVLIVCGGTPLQTLGGHLPLDRPFDVDELP
jgi:spore germination protein GerM